MFSTQFRRGPRVFFASAISDAVFLPYVLGILFCVAVIAGCGEPGAPQPPSLNLPQPVRNLSATRAGNTVHLEWKSTDRTTDHSPVSGTARTHICRMEGTGPCELVTDLPLVLGKVSQFDDTLPSDEVQGQPQLLTYYVELLNHARKSAGRSDAAYSASGQTAPDLTSLRATLRPEGVDLHWDPVAWPGDSADHLVRITRLDESPPPPKQTSAAGKIAFQTHEAPLQTLEVPAESKAAAKADPGAGPGATPGRAIDRTARFGETYKYQALCVEKLTIDGHAVEMVGPLSQPVSIFTKDTFPPAVPQQLDAVADPISHAIDLSWSPDSEPDLAGYIVYRSDQVGSGLEQAHRVSGDTPLPTPAFHDANVQPGLNYSYTVTAVDQSGNESQPSGVAVESLTP